MVGIRLAVAMAVIAGLLLPAPRALALSGVELPSAQEVLDNAELIVVARVGEVLGVVDSVDQGLRTLYRLHVESYLHPAVPGPDTLVLSVLGGIGLDRAMDGPQPGSGRGLYFLKRAGAVYVKAAGPSPRRHPCRVMGLPRGSGTGSSGCQSLPSCSTRRATRLSDRRWCG